MVKRCLVRLSQEERSLLRDIVKKLKEPSQMSDDDLSPKVSTPC